FTVTFFVSYLMRGSARSPLFPYTTLFRSAMGTGFHQVWRHVPACIVAALTLFACVLAVALVLYLTRLMLLVQLGFFTTLYALLGPMLYAAWRDLGGHPPADDPGQPPAPPRPPAPPPPSGVLEA